MKTVKIKHIITTELIKSLYEKARTLPPEQSKKLIEQCEFFTKHIGEYLVQEEKESDIDSMPENT